MQISLILLENVHYNNCFLCSFRGRGVLQVLVTPNQIVLALAVTEFREYYRKTKGVSFVRLYLWQRRTVLLPGLRHTQLCLARLPNI